MTIFFTNNTMHIKCNECGHSDIYYGRLAEAWADAKAAGWRVWENKPGEWWHACPPGREILSNVHRGARLT